jgi:hypothetical protein
MTQRERLTSSGGTEVAQRPGSEGSPRPAEEARTPLWEQVFLTATPERQRELLALARDQGVLYAHQLPTRTHSNGHGSNGNGSGNGDHGHTPLGQLLAGHTDHLEPLTPGAVEFIDADLDEAQRDAVARALSTPDLCLIQGLPGTGKSRVVAEIVLQAAQRGERVLLLSHASAALDRILELVGNHESLCPLRCHGREEPLSPLARSFTFDERLRALRDPALQRGREELATAEALAREMARANEALARLRELAENGRDLERRHAALAATQAALQAEVEAEAKRVDEGAAHGDGVASRLARAAAVFREQTAALKVKRTELAAAIEGLHKRRAGLTPRLDALRPAIENRRRGRWWTADWWRLLFSAKPAQEFDALETEEQKIQAELIGAEAETQRLERDRTNSEQAYQTLHDQVVGEEVVRRRSALAGEESVFRRDQECLGERWQATCGELPADLCPAAFTPEAVTRSGELWAKQRDDAEHRQQAAREWLTYLQQESETLASRLIQYANLVAATTHALAADEHFGTRSASHFDLLLVQEAELATRSELLALARRTRRCVLIGEPELLEGADRRADSAPLRSPAALQPSLFASLWQALAPGGRQLSCTWVTDRERPCCRLRPVTAEQRARLESERLADRPDIDLRILALPNARPVVAEIVFPHSMSVAQAKEFIWRELEELSISPAGPLSTWCQVDGRLSLTFRRSTAAPAALVDLGHGVREMLDAPATNGHGEGHPTTPWATGRIEFDGWDRPAAEAWVQRHLGLRDLGRAARLDVPHRMSPELARILSDLLFAGEYHLAHDGHHAPRNGARALEFISAARRPGGDGNGKGKKSPPRPPRGHAEGAGLELDLADRRHLDRLPADLRALLPNQGLVNYFEAQAVVRALETLAAQGATTLARTAVIALYPAQAELIRCLVSRCPTLASHSILIDTPAAFEEREYAIALVSLTRSHTHRAVSFGESPRALATALTRARSRLLVFGDPGTLARRGQWEIALDHLDGAAAARERAIIARLVQFADGAESCALAVATPTGAGV